MTTPQFVFTEHHKDYTARLQHIADGILQDERLGELEHRAAFLQSLVTVLILALGDINTAYAQEVLIAAQHALELNGAMETVQ